MTVKISFFPVGNGDMTLVVTDSGMRVLIDVNIRGAADDATDGTPDVAGQLKERLETDQQGRQYVDAMLLSHPDKDHCTGLEKHFHLGAPTDYVEGSGKILIREMWSSPIVFRRASNKLKLTPDAKAWAKEARRRVKVFKENGYSPANDRILILGEDEDGKTDDLSAILVKVDETWTVINGLHQSDFSALLLGPLPKGDDAEEDVLTKNNSSVITRFKLSVPTAVTPCRFLSGGDAEVAIWERQWKRNRGHAAERLGYDLLQAPHHCSWHSLSYDSWSDYGEDAEVNADARSALSQAKVGGYIVASSKPITDDDSDPPSVRAEREYEEIVAAVNGEFVCVGDDDEPLEFEFGPSGFRKLDRGPKSKVQKAGGGRFA